ncbi:hypothetical protein ACFL96_19035 [Thermoproteota archaeon]
MDKNHTTKIMHLLLLMIILGICWLFFVEFNSGKTISITGLFGWLVIIFIIPLILINFHDEKRLFTGGSALFALIYSLLSLAQLIELPDRSCCQIAGFIIIIASMLVCLTIIMLAIRDLLRFRRSYEM